MHARCSTRLLPRCRRPHSIRQPERVLDTAAPEMGYSIAAAGDGCALIASMVCPVALRSFAVTAAA